jgi:hypothetical protein
MAHSEALLALMELDNTPVALGFPVTAGQFLLTAVKLIVIAATMLFFKKTGQKEAKGVPLHRSNGQPLVAEILVCE